MSNKITGNETAYPSGMYGQQLDPGMSVRAAFAKEAMVAIVRNNENANLMNQYTISELCDKAVWVADNQIAALNRRPNPNQPVVNHYGGNVIKPQFPNDRVENGSSTLLKVKELSNEKIEEIRGEWQNKINNANVKVEWIQVEGDPYERVALQYKEPLSTEKIILTRDEVIEIAKLCDDIDEKAIVNYGWMFPRFDVNKSKVTFDPGESNDSSVWYDLPFAAYAYLVNRGHNIYNL